MPKAFKHREPARGGRDIRPGGAAEADEAVRADSPRPAGAPQLAVRAVAARQKARSAAASAFRKRKRVIQNLLRAVRSGGLEASVQLGAWGAALLAAGLIAESPDGVTLTPAGRAMLKEMSRKHTASAQAPGPLGPGAQIRTLARRRSPCGGEQTTSASS